MKSNSQIPNRTTENKHEVSKTLDAGLVESGPQTLYAAPPVLTGRRTFSAKFKQRILAEAGAAKTKGAVKQLLQREGLHYSYLTNWQQQLDNEIGKALAPKARGPRVSPKHSVAEVRELTRKNQRLEKRIRNAKHILKAQEKVVSAASRPKTEERDV